jgi:hypothetical protein
MDDAPANTLHKIEIELDGGTLHAIGKVQPINEELTGMEVEDGGAVTVSAAATVLMIVIEGRIVHDEGEEQELEPGTYMLNEEGLHRVPDQPQEGSADEQG